MTVLSLYPPIMLGLVAFGSMRSAPEPTTSRTPPPARAANSLLAAEAKSVPVESLQTKLPWWLALAR